MNRGAHKAGCERPALGLWGRLSSLLTGWKAGPTWFGPTFAVPSVLFRHVSLPIVLLLLGTAVATADYAIDWHTIDGGGEMQSTGGTYELSGTIGQPDAGPGAPGFGGTYSLTGGFWFGCVPGDGDCDGDVDLGDFADFETCLGGPGGGLGPDCGCFDLDGNGDVDLIDFAGFQLAYTG